MFKKIWINDYRYDRMIIIASGRNGGRIMPISKQNSRTGRNKSDPLTTVPKDLAAGLGEKLTERIAQLFAPAAEMERLNRKEYLTEKEVGVLFSVSTATLRAERSRGQGPGYVKDGRRILYPRKELDAYYSNRLVKTLDYSE